MHSLAHHWYWRLLALILVTGLLFIAYSVSRAEEIAPQHASAAGILLLKDGTVLTTSDSGSTLYYWRVNPVATDVIEYSFEDGTARKKTLHRE